MHGANRLASNSLLEAVVFGPRVAQDILGAELPELAAISGLDREGDDAAAGSDEISWRNLQGLAYEHLGVVREEAGLRHLVKEAWGLMDRAASYSLRNGATVVFMAAVAALTRTESRGAHFRTDYPETAQQALRTFLTLNDAIARVDTLNVHKTFDTRQA